MKVVDNITRFWPLFIIGLTSLAFGFVNETNSLFLWSLLFVCISIGAIQILETKYSVLIVLTFISFQGFFKVVSNYHPVIHLGADIVVITLILKFTLLRFFNQVKETAPLPPFTLLFAIHFGWVFISLFNPYSLGAIPSIAGSKVYVSMFVLYFFGYYLTQSIDDVKLYFRVFIGLALIHSVFAFIQGFLGPASVMWIHPRYAVQLAKYAGTAFRPFGLTHVPGAPSVYIYPSLAFMAYFLLQSRSRLGQLFLLASLPIVGQALLFCQVRSSIGKGLIAIASFIVLYLTSRMKVSYEKKVSSLAMVTLSTLAVLFILPYFMKASIDSLDTNAAAFERSLSTFDLEAMSKARKNTLDRFINYLGVVPFGAGFSRVGASAGAFKRANKNDVFFKPGYFFADNLFITTLIELGIPGLLILTTLILCILARGFQSWRTETRQELIGPQLAILASLFAIFLGSYGSEGIIYNPESAFFWFFSGVLIRISQKDFPSSEGKEIQEV